MGLRTSSTGFNLNIDSYSNIAFHTDTDLNEGGGAGTEKLRITTTGNVGIGTVTPTQLLHLSSVAGPSALIDATPGSGQAGLKMIAGSGTTNRATRIDFLNGVSSTTVPRWTILNDYNQNGTNDLGIADSSSVPVFTIRQGGNVGIGTTAPSYTLHVNGSVAGVGSYVALSDIRYKKNIQDLADSLAKVLAIRGVSYNWMDEKTYGSDTQFGVIAQEIEQIVPEVVTTGSDGVKRVKYSDLIPLVIEALKAEKVSKDAEIGRLKAEAAQLKARADRAEVESAQLKAALCHKFPDLPVCGQ
jgi:hypothetical protein